MTEFDQLKADIASARTWSVAHVWFAAACVAALLFFKVI